MIREEPSETEKLTAKVELSLRNRYCEPEWLSFFEVTGDTGRRADCIAINMFSSRGHKVIGFEIKASRQDWLKELKEGYKADFFYRHCDEWYVVEAKRDIVDKRELPPGWGLITLQKDRLFTKVSSTKKDSEVLSRYFYCQMLRKCFERNVDKNVIYEAEMRAYKKAQVEKMTGYDVKELNEKAKVVDDLSEKGLFLWRYTKQDIERIITALNFLNKIDGDWRSASSIIKRLEDGHKEGIENLNNMKGILAELNRKVRESLKDREENNGLSNAKKVQ